MQDHSLTFQPTAASVAGDIPVANQLTQPDEEQQISYLCNHCSRETRFWCLPPEPDTHEPLLVCGECGCEYFWAIEARSA
jgi:DNA-directed RNA polymerase subunit RPC12/RpoP